MSELSVKSREDIFNALADILNDMFEIPRDRIVPTANLYTDLDIDSIDAVDLVVKLSQLTGQRMQPETFKSIRTIDDVVNALVPMLLEDKA